jgi:hypothetical protein
VPQKKKIVNEDASNIQNLFLKHIKGTTEDKYLMSRNEA